MGIQLQEHTTSNLSFTRDFKLLLTNPKEVIFFNEEKPSLSPPRIFKTERNKDYHCFTYEINEENLNLKSDYFVGIDWLTKDRYIFVEPKMNFTNTLVFEEILNSTDPDISETEEVLIDQKNKFKVEQPDEKTINEINLIEMLLQITSQPISENETNKLLLIDWNAPMIRIEQKQDLLTPFLIIRFLSVLKVITRKGLKKSYYKVEENLRNRIKGKIVVSSQIRQNILKNRLTHTLCTYEVYGEDHLENRFLKKVFEFCVEYISKHPIYFEQNNTEVKSLISYIRPKFDLISSDIQLNELKHFKHNPFFKEYKEASSLGKMILKRFSYHLSTDSDNKTPTPPYWIDMPKLFELYVYALFLKDNPELNSKNFNYQFSTFGNSLDFLINTDNLKMVVDAKYKLKYKYSKVHEDIRQVAGYARLKKVREKLKIDDDQNIPCLIVYPSVEKTTNSLHLNNIDQALQHDYNQIKAYHKIYKVGIQLPVLK